MKHLVEHSLDFATAKLATSKAFDNYIERFREYKPSAEWVSDKQAQIAFDVKGVKLKGSLEIEQSAIAIDLKVPFLFRMFQKKAVDIVEREIRKWITKAEAGELSS